MGSSVIAGMLYMAGQVVHGTIPCGIFPIDIDMHIPSGTT